MSACASIETACICLELELDVRYIHEPAEPDVGHPENAEIVSVSLNGVEVKLTRDQYESIIDQLI